MPFQFTGFADEAQALAGLHVERDAVHGLQGLDATSQHAADPEVDGEIVEVNEGLRDDPALANSDPTGAGWFFKVKLSNPAQLDALMDKTAYDELLKNA